jgi:hypothetical protein
MERSKNLPKSRKLSASFPSMSAFSGKPRPRSFAAPALITAVAVAFSTCATLGATTAAAVDGNLVVNGDFEGSTDGWAANKMPNNRDATLSRVSGGHSGGFAARVKAEYTGLVTLNDSPNTVDSATAFKEYAAEAFVRTITPGVPVQLRIQEIVGGNVAGTGHTTVTLNDTAWHALSTTYTPAFTGSSLNLNVISYQVPAGKSFDVDDISLLEVTPPVDPARWAPVYRNDFSTMTDVRSMRSSITANDAVRPSDSTPETSQAPTVPGNVAIATDPAASDGRALGVHTRKATYSTSSGDTVGWTNGRMTLANHDAAPPVRIAARMRFTSSVKTKAAVMWWPAGGGWPWEIDFAETFGGNSLTDYWGGRQHVGQRWHADLNGDGKANEQLMHDDTLDATKYHDYVLTIGKDYMTMTIDGTKTFETRDMAYIPDTAGFFSIGKALSGRRDATDRTNDSVYVDWLEISKPVTQ